MAAVIDVLALAAVKPQPPKGRGRCQTCTQRYGSAAYTSEPEGNTMDPNLQTPEPALLTWVNGQLTGGSVVDGCPESFKATAVKP